MRSTVRARSVEFPLASSGQPWRSHQRRADLEERARKAVAYTGGLGREQSSSVAYCANGPRSLDLALTGSLGLRHESQDGESDGRSLNLHIAASRYGHSSTPSSPSAWIGEDSSGAVRVAGGARRGSGGAVRAVGGSGCRAHGCVHGTRSHGPGRIRAPLVSATRRPGEREVTYWIGRSYWGRGIATSA